MSAEEYLQLRWPCPSSSPQGDGFCPQGGACTASGRTHHGVDYSMAVGTVLKAAHSGTVHTGASYSWSEGGAGIRIGGTVGGDSISTYYGHLSQYLVADGAEVVSGDPIALSGGEPGAWGAGNSAGPHLHFALQIRGDYADPRTYLILPYEVGGAADSDLPDFPYTGTVPQPTLPAITELVGRIAALAGELMATDETGVRAWPAAHGYGDKINVNELENYLDYGNIGEATIGSEAYGVYQRIVGTFQSVGAWEGATPIERAADPLFRIADFFSLLTQGSTWKRIGFVTGGIVVGWLGFKWLGSSLGAWEMPGPAQTVKRTVGIVAARGGNEAGGSMAPRRAPQPAAPDSAPRPEAAARPFPRPAGRPVPAYAAGGA